ncbi:hypothetical protein PRIPAC_77362, partial [Pristionchus pacificus]|uniref:Uncharacterized protein n=1 Tax=Pristionchus pacificus TaxID=54126 RepID=A0A2A6BWA4_PRIPA
MVDYFGQLPLEIKWLIFDNCFPTNDMRLVNTVWRHAVDDYVVQRDPVVSFTSCSTSMICSGVTVADTLTTILVPRQFSGTLRPAMHNFITIFPSTQISIQ